MKMLVIEDDEETASYVVNGLTEHGHIVDHAANGRDGLFLAAGERYDLIVADRMLPGLDGAAIVKTIRSAGIKTPVLFLSALDGIDDRVRGLDAGADDYLVKPFAFAELIARLNALSRRPALAAADTKLQIGDLELDCLTRRVVRSGQLIVLQPTEFKLLEILMRNAGQVVTRTILLEQVWGFHFDPHTSVVETLISRLRSKVNKGFASDLIQTFRGAGYSINASP